KPQFRLVALDLAGRTVFEARWLGVIAGPPAVRIKMCIRRRTEDSSRKIVAHSCAVNDAIEAAIRDMACEQLVQVIKRAVLFHHPMGLKTRGQASHVPDAFGM